MLVRKNDLFPAFSGIFGDVFGNELTNWSRENYSPNNSTLPAVNIKEEEDKFTVEVAIPGMNKNDFNIDLKDNLLTISSTKESKDNEEVANYTRQEYCYHSFTRTFTLPDNIVDAEKISAKYENGELKVSIPKKEEAKPKPLRTIKIS